MKAIDQLEKLFPKDKEHKELISKIRESRNKSKITHMLSAIRCRENLTQRQLAERIGHKQGYISRFEDKEDNDIKLGDLAEIVTALDHEVHVFIAIGKRLKRAQQMKYHIEQFKRLFKEVYQICGEDAEMLNGLAGHCVTMLDSIINTMMPEIVEKIKEIDGLDNYNEPISVLEEEETEHIDQGKNKQKFKKATKKEKNKSCSQINYVKKPSKQTKKYLYSQLLHWLEKT